jgi:hypothetical protein
MLDHYNYFVTKLQEKNYFCMGLSKIREILFTLKEYCIYYTSTHLFIIPESSWKIFPFLVAIFSFLQQGTNGLEQHIDTVFDNATYFTEKIKKTEGFRMVLWEPECTNVCFWYIPPSLRGQEVQHDFNERLHKVMYAAIPFSVWYTYLWLADTLTSQGWRYSISEVGIPKWQKADNV